MANRTKTRIENLHIKDLKPEDKIAPNFYVHELTRSDLALRLGIDNSLPGDDELRAAVHLTREVMQPIRDAQGRFLPNSVFRSQALERVLKTAPAGLGQHQPALRRVRLRHRDPGPHHPGTGQVGGGQPAGLRPDHLRVLRSPPGTELRLGAHLPQAPGAGHQPPPAPELYPRPRQRALGLCPRVGGSGPLSSSPVSSGGGCTFPIPSVSAGSGLPDLSMGPPAQAMPGRRAAGGTPAPPRAHGRSAQTGLSRE